MAKQETWTAKELLALSPEERRRVFDDAIVTNLDQYPPNLLERVRASIREHIASKEATLPPER